MFKSWPWFLHTLGLGTLQKLTQNVYIYPSTQDHNKLCNNELFQMVHFSLSPLLLFSVNLINAANRLQNPLSSVPQINQRSSPHQRYSQLYNSDSSKHFSSPQYSYVPRVRPAAARRVDHPNLELYHQKHLHRKPILIRPSSQQDFPRKNLNERIHTQPGHFRETRKIGGHKTLVNKDTLSNKSFPKKFNPDKEKKLNQKLLAKDWNDKLNRWHLRTTYCDSRCKKKFS